MNQSGKPRETTAQRRSWDWQLRKYITLHAHLKCIAIQSLLHGCSRRDTPCSKKLVSRASLRSDAWVPIKHIIEKLQRTSSLLSSFPCVIPSQKWTFLSKNGLWTCTMGPLFLLSFPRDIFFQNGFSREDKLLFQVFPWCVRTFCGKMRFETIFLWWIFSQWISSRRTANALLTNL